MSEVYPLYLAATVICELLVAFVWARAMKRAFPWVDLLIVNVISHPIAFMLTGDVPFWLIESGVILVEALGYRVLTRLTPVAALGLSLLTNLVTIALSFV